MNKSQLIEIIQKQMGADTSKHQAEKVLSMVTEAIISGIKESGKVQIVGFGSFALKTRSARMGRNPKTGASVSIPETNYVSFKASPSFLQ